MGPQAVTQLRAHNPLISQKVFKQVIMWLVYRHKLLHD